MTATASTATGRTVVAPHLSVQVGTQASSDRLLAGQSLQPGQALRVVGQPISLVLQPNGDLVLYWGAGTLVLWARGTSGGAVTQAVMQADGNFVLYPGSEAAWATETNGNRMPIWSCSQTGIWSCSMGSTPPSGGQARGLPPHRRGPPRCFPREDGST